jgi:hypothetical protein
MELLSILPIDVCRIIESHLKDFKSKETHLIQIKEICEKFKKIERGFLEVSDDSHYCMRINNEKFQLQSSFCKKCGNFYFEYLPRNILFSERIVCNCMYFFEDEIIEEFKINLQLILIFFALVFVGVYFL